MERSEMNRRVHSVEQNPITNGSIENIPIFYQQGGMQEQENQEFFYGMVYKLLAETEEERNLYICDGKNDELYRVYM